MLPLWSQCQADLQSKFLPLEKIGMHRLDSDCQ
jgi:hypothetical protein